MNRKMAVVIGFGLLVLWLFFSAVSKLASIDTTQLSPTPTVLSEKESPSETPQPIHNGISTKVINVIDGDTVKIESGEVVRLIGIDTPETSGGGECYSSEATKKLEELVLNKEVELEKDVSETDRYQRLLRYIWIGDTLVNQVLVWEGYAKVSTYPPDVKYQERFKEAERVARESKAGLWGDACAITPTPKASTPTKTPTTTPKPTVKTTTTTAPQPITQPQTGGGSYTCNCSKTCPQMSSCAEAQYQLNVCGCGARDADKDGIACDADCQ
jgi:micrococcal nuclease